jgi:hypothetical protein
VYYADVDDAIRGQLRAPALAEDLQRLTGLPLERRAEGVALINTGSRLTDITFPGTGTVAQAALLLCARIAGYLERNRGRVEYLPAATAAERLAESAARIDAALPALAGVAALIAEETVPEAETGSAAGTEGGTAEGISESVLDVDASAAYPFLARAWLRAELRKLIAEFGGGMSERQVADPDGLLDDALDLLSSVGIVACTSGGALILPLLARYRGVTAQLKERPQ